MGTWLGHAAPGTFFICFALWWLIRAMQNYYSRQRNKPYMNQLSMQCCCKGGCCGRLPLDSWVLILVAIIGVIMEVATSMASNNNEVVMGNRQHLTMYISFGLVGLTTILVHHNFKFVPKGAEYMVLIAALTIELVLFRFHLHGRNDTDIHLHMLLVYVIAACIFTTGLEMLFPESINPLLARVYLTLLQGTWFHQIGFTLYTPMGMTKEELEDPESVMAITLIFAWHMIGCVMLILILNGLVYWCCSPKCRGDYSNEDSMNLIPVGQSKHFHGTGTDSRSSAIMNGYNSVGSGDEEDMFTAPQKSDPS